MEESVEEKKEDIIGREEVQEEVENLICDIKRQGIHEGNIDFLGKLIDIHKDIDNEKYWDVKKEGIKMRYGNYGGDSYGRDEYGRGSYGRDEYGEGRSYGRRSRDSRGRYTGGSSYGRRYRGHDMLDDMYGTYSEYAENRDEYNCSGNYGAKEDSVKSLEYMMKSAYDFICMLNEEADSQDEIEIIRKYAQKISEL